MTTRFGHGVYDDKLEATRQQLSQCVFESSELLFGRLQLIVGFFRFEYFRRRAPRATVVWLGTSCLVAVN
jgi:hypothetical protein